MYVIFRNQILQKYLGRWDSNLDKFHPIFFFSNLCFCYRWIGKNLIQFLEICHGLQNKPYVKWLIMHARYRLFIYHTTLLLLESSSVMSTAIVLLLQSIFAFPYFLTIKKSLIKTWWTTWSHVLRNVNVTRVVNKFYF